MRDDARLHMLGGLMPINRQKRSLLPLSCEGLCFDAGGMRLLGPVDLTLAPGRITVVMGHNGAGKSLLLGLLHGLRAPSAGTVRWSTRDSGDTLRRRQAMVFQKPVLLRRSVAANVDFALKTRGRPDPDRRDALLAHVGLSHLAARPARKLSGGEQQRLSLARALATEPEILFLDEPTASLDPASVRAIEDIVFAAHDAGTKIVFVTHDLGQARRLADEIVFLHDGRVAEQTLASTFFDKPRSAAALAYLEGRLPL
ncbi:tungstate transport system ATP-binding protein [Poseidonocella pacifica]|uniref:Tungstate transport system ATP-binding protein n=1 Tax=Poseidonocella pacifica TaxID=871651 RepID=A0A1I0XE53_9RHOB|nr:ATP-binding cassette domain-containing protein [Poseidonocella pacifica]SFA99281.1 tungstate transport system ATP-binding protein [Poseidonocella pacifica]